MIITRTPLRISFFGGGSDYPEYFKRGREGLVLGASIDKYVYISVNRLASFFEHSIRVTYSKAELVQSVDQIVHPSVRECLRFFDIGSHIEIHHFADLPARTGLGSSSSFTVGLLHALYAFKGKMVRKDRLSEEAIHIEREKIGERVGCQDQYLASRGGINLISFSKDRTIVEPLPLTAQRRDELRSSLMLFYTRTIRYAHEILQEQVEKTLRQDNDPALARMVEISREGIRVLTGGGSLENFGSLLHESWGLKKSLNSKITTPIIEEAYDESRRLGAWGGKLAGAGGGGFLLLCAPVHAKEAIRKALEAKGLQDVSFNFESDGSRVIYFEPD